LDQACIIIFDQFWAYYCVRTGLRFGLITLMLFHSAITVELGHLLSRVFVTEPEPCRHCCCRIRSRAPSRLDLLTPALLSATGTTEGGGGTITTAFLPRELRGNYHDCLATVSGQIDQNRPIRDVNKCLVLVPVPVSNIESSPVSTFLDH